MIMCAQYSAKEIQSE